MKPKRTIAATGGIKLARYSTRQMVEIENAMAEYADRIGKAFRRGADLRAVDVTIKIQHDTVKASVKAGLSDDPGRGLSLALSVAHLTRTGWFRAAHVKSAGCHRTLLLLKHRRNLKVKFLDLENAIRHFLTSFGVLGRRALEQARHAGDGRRCADERTDGRDAFGASLR
ncbi:hypothetical protein G6L08_00080 [Agrobacterium rhizogenes]|nr:hypothetical protein [Rhizobium rhizogenes]